MVEEEILQRLIPIFKTVFNDEELEVTMELTSNDIDSWSSISQTLMITQIQKEFGISFKLFEVARMNDVKTIVTIIYWFKSYNWYICINSDNRKTICIFVLLGNLIVHISLLFPFFSNIDHLHL